jgi:hypothetical protein
LEKVEKMVKFQNLSYVIAQMNAEESVNVELAEREGVDGFPTIAIYKEGRRIGDYNGHRNEGDMIKYLKMKAGPSAQYVSSMTQLQPYLDQLIDQEDEDSHYSGIISIVLALIVSPETGSIDSIRGRLVDSFFKVASECDLALFFLSDSPELVDLFIPSNGLHQEAALDSMVIFYAEADLPQTNHVTISLHRSVEAGNGPFQMQPFSDEDILHTLLSHSLPPVIQYNADLQPVIQSLPIKQHVLFFCDPLSSAPSVVAFIDAVENVAQAKEHKVLLVLEHTRLATSLLHTSYTCSSLSIDY